MNLWPRRRRQPAAPVAADRSEAFIVELRKSGLIVRVPPGASALDVLLAHGVDVDYRCRNGLCGSCQTRLLEGKVDHRDTFLTEDEQNRFMMPCVSRAPAGEHVVLDL